MLEQSQERTSVFHFQFPANGLERSLHCFVARRISYIVVYTRIVLVCAGFLLLFRPWPFH